MKAATGACAIAMLAFIGTARLAGAADIRVYSTGAPAMAAKAVAEDFAKNTGHHLIVHRRAARDHRERSRRRRQG